MLIGIKESAPSFNRKCHRGLHTYSRQLGNQSSNPGQPASGAGRRSERHAGPLTVQPFMGRCSPPFSSVLQASPVVELRVSFETERGVERMSSPRDSVSQGCTLVSLEPTKQS